MAILSSLNIAFLIKMYLIHEENSKELVWFLAVLFAFFCRKKQRNHTQRFAFGFNRRSKLPKNGVFGVCGNHGVVGYLNPCAAKLP